MKSLKLICEVCSKARGAGDHSRCSKILQAKGGVKPTKRAASTNYKKPTFISGFLRSHGLD